MLRSLPYTMDNFAARISKKKRSIVTVNNGQDKTKLKASHNSLLKESSPRERKSTKVKKDNDKKKMRETSVSDRGTKVKHPISKTFKSGKQRVKMSSNSVDKSIEQQEQPISVQRRHQKRAVIKSMKKVQCKQNTESTTLLLRNLPPSVNYAILQTTVPTAHRFQLYKKGKKRHAFAHFNSQNECEEAVKSLKGVVLEERAIRVTVVTPKGPSEQAPTFENAAWPADRCISLSNLPFSLSKLEIEEEFPTASNVVMNTNKHGRFRGSCLLVFDTTDDCEIAQKACRGRIIGGRPVRFSLGIRFEAKPNKENPSHGIKIRNIPLDVDLEQLKAIFPEKSVVKGHMNKDVSRPTQTGVVVFADQAAQKDALYFLSAKKFFGVRLHARPWTPVVSRTKTKLITQPNISEAGNGSEVKITDKSPKKSKLTKNSPSPNLSSPGDSDVPNLFPQSPEVQVTTPVIKSEKKHKRKHDTLLDDSPTSITKEPKKKKAKTLSGSPMKNYSSELLNGTKSTSKKKLKKNRERLDQTL